MQASHKEIKELKAQLGVERKLRHKLKRDGTAAAAAAKKDLNEQKLVHENQREQILERQRELRKVCAVRHYEML